MRYNTDVGNVALQLTERSMPSNMEISNAIVLCSLNTASIMRGLVDGGWGCGLRVRNLTGEHYAKYGGSGLYRRDR